MNWRVIGDSVEGTSHKLSRLGCQDFHYYTPLRVADEDYLLLSCADGAGTAIAASLGADLACKSIVDAVARYLEEGQKLDHATSDTVTAWFVEARESLSRKAIEDGLELRDLSCTLLLAVVGPTSAVYGHIGDGAIVVSDGDGYRCVFWPFSGEYQNCTAFLTSPDFPRNLQTQSTAACPQELALFTDGLQMLALNYATRTAHEPFFRSLLHSLRASDNIHDLHTPFRQFLTSDAVNSRTDDDKTLVLATRMPSEQCTSATAKISP